MKTQDDKQTKRVVMQMSMSDHPTLVQDNEIDISMYEVVGRKSFTPMHKKNRGVKNDGQERTISVSAGPLDT